jgi:hypothetical protein
LLKFEFHFCQRNVNDIDLYAGGLSETIVQDPLYTTGSTFGCIIMEQFTRLKNVKTKLE